MVLLGFNPFDGADVVASRGAAFVINNPAMAERISKSWVIIIFFALVKKIFTAISHVCFFLS